jgi:phosphonate transport system permease protein
VRRSLWRAALGLAVLAIYGWFLAATEVSLPRFLRGVPWMADFVRRMVPPDLSVLSSAVVGALQTLQIAVVGTTVAALLALPLGFLSARNVAPASLFYPARALLNFFRSIDTMVYALFFVASVGLGPFPGVLAVVTYTVMTLAKLYSEAIEGIDPGPIEAIQATGATRLQTIMYAVVPQMISPFVSFSIYRWDVNVRMSTVIGLVGGGGVGFILVQYIRLLDYRAAGIAVWFIAVTVAILDYVSAEIRARFV